MSKSREEAIAAAAWRVHESRCQSSRPEMCVGFEDADVTSARRALDAAHEAGHIAWADDVTHLKDELRRTVTDLNTLIARGSLDNHDAEVACRLRDRLGGLH